MTGTIGSGASMQAGGRATTSRRDLLALIGTVAGSAVMYEAMSSLGLAADSGYKL